MLAFKLPYDAGELFACGARRCTSAVAIHVGGLHVGYFIIEAGDGFGHVGPFADERKLILTRARRTFHLLLPSCLAYVGRPPHLLRLPASRAPGYLIS